jgi:excisionase family DNA binding protein
VKSILLLVIQIERDNQKVKLLGIKEVSEILNVKPATLYQWAELGQIPCMKLNGALRFDIEEIMKWVKSCKKEVSSGYNPLVQTRSPRKGGK